LAILIKMDNKAKNDSDDEFEGTPVDNSQKTITRIMVTYFHQVHEKEKWEKELDAIDGIEFWVYQEEKCPKTSRIHYHFYIKCEKSLKLFNRINNIFPGGCKIVSGRKREDRYGIGYCTKDRTRTNGPWWSKGITEDKIRKIQTWYKSYEISDNKVKIDKKKEEKTLKEKVDAAYEKEFIRTMAKTKLENEMDKKLPKSQRSKLPSIYSTYDPRSDPFAAEYEKNPPFDDYSHLLPKIDLELSPEAVAKLKANIPGFVYLKHRFMNEYGIDETSAEGMIDTSHPALIGPGPGMSLGSSDKKDCKLNFDKKSTP